MTTQQPSPLNKQAVVNAFNQAAAQYNKFAFVQEHIANLLCEQVVSKVDAPDVIIDYGSGTGSLTNKFTQHYPQAAIFGTDIAFNMTQEAKKHSRHPSFICADIEQSPFQAECADVIVSNCTLQWCHNLPQIFKQAIQILKPGGQLFFTSLGPNTLHELRHAWQSANAHPHVHPFVDMHNIGDMLKKAGFTHPVMQREDLQFTYASVKQVMQDLKGIGAQNRLQARNKGLTTPKQLQRMIQAYEQFKQADRYIATYEVYFGYAVKKNDQ